MSQISPYRITCRSSYVFHTKSFAYLFFGNTLYRVIYSNWLSCIRLKMRSKFLRVTFSQGLYKSCPKAAQYSVKSRKTTRWSGPECERNNQREEVLEAFESRSERNGEEGEEENCKLSGLNDG